MLIALPLAMLSCLPEHVVAQSAAAKVEQAVAAPLSPKARGELARQFVRKWGAYVQTVYGTPVGAWAERMVPTFVAADPANFRRALRRETLEGALAELDGTGQRLSDARVIERMAREPLVAQRTAGPKTLGSTSGDLVFTPIQPCRIVDTRVAGGQIAADGTRNFRAVSASNYTAQGGSATDCGLGTTVATAVALNVTAVTPGTAGFATVYPFGSTRPLAASVNYAAGSIVNNAIIAQIPNPLQASDFTVYTFAQSHYVIDIVGYFAPPQATALDCVDITGVIVNVPINGSNNAGSGNCPAGYTITGGSCISMAGTGRVVTSSTEPTSQFCAFFNGSSTSAMSAFAKAKCCRVPGR